MTRPLRSVAPETEGPRDRAWAAAAAVVDPEIPVLSVADLGVLRDVRVDEDGRATAVITPTYSGCPAMLAIELSIVAALDEAGFEDARVETVLSPAWTTDWLTEEGRAALKAYGIAPPAGASKSKLALFGAAPAVSCPQCGASETEKISEFGSTACKSLWRCRACFEPFDYFKCI